MQARHTTFALSCLLLAAPVLAQDPPKMSPEELAAMQAYQQAGTPGPQTINDLNLFEEDGATLITTRRFFESSAPN